MTEFLFFVLLFKLWENLFCCVLEMELEYMKFMIIVIIVKYAAKPRTDSKSFDATDKLRVKFLLPNK